MHGHLSEVKLREVRRAKKSHLYVSVVPVVQRQKRREVRADELTVGTVGV